MQIIIGISGSLRRGSYNTALLRAAAAHAPPQAKVEIVSIAGIPLYNGDLEEEQGLPSAVRTMKEQIAAADGLLLVTPEYNNSIPGVFKNAIDWLSRPGLDIERIFGNKAVALMGATPGRGGTRLAQAAWLPVLRTLGVRTWSGDQLFITGAGQVFDSTGRLKDEKVETLLRDFMAGFSRFISGS